MPLTGLSQRDMLALAALSSPTTVTRAIVYSSTPVVLLMLVKQALYNVTPVQDRSFIVAQPVLQRDGTFGGISAVSWRLTGQTTPLVPYALVPAGFAVLCASWAVWVYDAELMSDRQHRRGYTQPLHWALLTILTLPVGLLAYLYNRSDRVEGR